MTLEQLLKQYARDNIFLIAEAGTAHEGSFERAVALIKAAAEAGVSAVKFQHVIADEVLHPQSGAFPLTYAPTKTALKQEATAVPLYQEFKRLSQGVDFFRELKRVAEQAGLLFMVSAFGEQSAKEVASLNLAAHKIASPELNYLGLWDTLLQHSQPDTAFFFSRGVSEWEDLRAILSQLAARKVDFNHLALLQCVTAYPAPEKDYRLALLPVFMQRFGLTVGVSDHTFDAFFLPEVAAALMAQLGRPLILEKHFTLERSGKGLDAAVALLPEALRILNRRLKAVYQLFQKQGSDSVQDQKTAVEAFSSEASWETFLKNLSQELPYSKTRLALSLGNFTPELTPLAWRNWQQCCLLSESESESYPTTKRSLLAIKDLKPGERLSKASARYLRCEKKLAPGLSHYWEERLEELVAQRPIKSGEGIDWSKVALAAVMTKGAEGD